LPRSARHDLPDTALRQKLDHTLHRRGWSASSRRSNDLNKRVLEWNCLTQINSVGGQASCRKKRTREESQQNCVHAPFTMRFANFVFQGRETHDMWWPRAREATQKQDCKVRLDSVRLFPDISESEKEDGRPHPDIRACSLCTSNIRTCACWSSNLFSTNRRIDCGSCLGACSEAVTVSIDIDWVKVSLQCRLHSESGGRWDRLEDGLGY
jgi:hypothetical protein